jgi:outer membrane protein TolC
MVTMALDRRPDLRAQQLTKQVNELNIQSALNLLKPNLNATGYYQTYGRGGPGYVRNVFVPGSPIDAFNMMGRFDYPTYNFGVTLNLPLRDHTASANLADAVVNQRLAALRERTIQQTVRQDVLTAVTNVEASREGVKQALIVRDYSRKRAEADQKRYDLGVINIFYLLASQNDLTTAESNVVTQVVTYRRNVLTLQQRLGTLLDDKGIVVQ